jgi:hypothetical protein
LSVPIKEHPVEDKHSLSRRDRPHGFKIAVAGQYGLVSEALRGYDERVDVKSVCRITMSSALRGVVRLWPEAAELPCELTHTNQRDHD